MKLIGLARLGRDAEVRFTPSGDAVAGLSLAVNYGKRDADGNQPTQWINASLWGKRAESLAQYLTKGSVHCFTLSEVHIEQREGNDGKSYTNLVARVDDVQLGPRVSESSGSSARDHQHVAAPRVAQTQALDDDTDIPF
jgi:single-strand DNA-binding protein